MILQSVVGEYVVTERIPAQVPELSDGPIQDIKIGLIAVCYTSGTAGTCGTGTGRRVARLIKRVVFDKVSGLIVRAMLDVTPIPQSPLL